MIFFTKYDITLQELYSKVKTGLDKVNLFWLTTLLCLHGIFYDTFIAEGVNYFYLYMFVFALKYYEKPLYLVKFLRQFLFCNVYFLVRTIEIGMLWELIKLNFADFTVINKELIIGYSIMIAVEIFYFAYFRKRYDCKKEEIKDDNNSK